MVDPHNGMGRGGRQNFGREMTIRVVPPDENTQNSKAE